MAGRCLDHGWDFDKRFHHKYTESWVEGRHGNAHADPDMYRWGNLRAKGVKTIFEISSNGQRGAMDAFAAVTRWYFEIQAPDIPAKEPYREGSQGGGANGHLGTGRGMRQPQPWASNSEPEVNLPGPRCSRWREMLYKHIYIYIYRWMFTRWLSCL